MKTLDIFSTGPNLTIQGKTTAKNEIGGIFSICVLSVLIFMALNSTVTLFKRKKLNVTTNLGNLNEEDYQHFSGNNTLLSFRVQDDKQLKLADEERIFSYNITSVSFELKADNEGFYEHHKNFTQMYYDNCSNLIYDKFEKDQTTKFMSHYNCIKDIHKDEMFKEINKTKLFINIKIKHCQNNTDLNYTTFQKKINCLSREEQIERLNNQQLYLVLNYVDYKLDIKNFENPLNPLIETNYLLIDSAFFIRTDMIFNQLKISTDYGYINENIKYDIVKNLDSQKQFFKNKKTSSSTLVNISVYFKSEATIIERSYYKIVSMIAELGSFFSICVNFCTIALLPVKDKLISCEIMSELYDFRVEETHSRKSVSKKLIEGFMKKGIKNQIIKVPSDNFSKISLSISKDGFKDEILKPKNEINSKSKKYHTEGIHSSKTTKFEFKLLRKAESNEISKVIDKDCVESNKDQSNLKDESENMEITKNKEIESHPVNINEMPYQNEDVHENHIKEINSMVKKIESLSNSIYSKKHDLSRIKYSSLHLFLSVFFCDFCKPEKVLNLDKLYDKCNKDVKEYLDINVMVRKIKEIESLKLLSFNQEQISCFNYFVKPEVDHVNCFRYSSKIQNHYKNTSDQDKIKQIIHYFLDKRHGNASTLDSKILEMLDEELVELIDTSLALSNRRNSLS